MSPIFLLSIIKIVIALNIDYCKIGEEYCGSKRHVGCSNSNLQNDDGAGLVDLEKQNIVLGHLNALRNQYAKQHSIVNMRKIVSESEYDNY